MTSRPDQRIDPYLGTVVHVVGERQARPNLPSTGCPFCVGVVDKCRSASGEKVIEPDFWKGTADAVNSTAAAVCLLDLEYAALPPEARDLYAKDSRIGLAFPVIGYNTGGGWSASVFKKIQKSWAGKEGAFSLEAYREFPVEVFWGTKKGKPFFNQEPCFYVFKWFRSWIDFKGDEFVPNCKGG